MKRILITGIDGFFGRNLVDRWIDKYEMLGIDLPPDLFDERNEEAIKWAHSINHIDIREDPEHYQELFHGVDTVVHCAAKTRINPSWHQYPDYYSTNITGSQNIFAMAQKLGVKKFIHFSSSSVYGNQEGQLSETNNLYPTNPYAVSKAAGEMALTAQSVKGDTELIIVRPFTMYGEHMNFGQHGLVIAKFLKAMSKGEPLMLEGGGNQIRDFIHANDAIDALELIMEHGNHKDVYNIGTGQTVSVKELADVVSSKQVIAPDRVGAVQSTWADISKLEQFGYSPKVKVKDWLTQFVHDLKM